VRARLTSVSPAVALLANKLLALLLYFSSLAAAPYNFFYSLSFYQSSCLFLRASTFKIYFLLPNSLRRVKH